MKQVIKYLNGQITIIHLVGWGLIITMSVGGAFWAKVNKTDAAIEEFKDKVSDDKVEYSTDIARIDANISNIVKTLDKIDKKLEEKN